MELSYTIMLFSPLSNEFSSPLYPFPVLLLISLHFGIPYGRFVSKAIIACILYMFYFKKHRIDYKKHNISHINLIFLQHNI